MKKRILLLVFIPIVYFGYKYFFEKPILKTTDFKEGRWISTVDPLSGIEIKNGKWITFYNGLGNENTLIYDFKIRAEERISDADQRLDEYLVIFNDYDTLEYYIIEYNNEFLSLSYSGRGNTLNYQPEKSTPSSKKESFLKANNNIWTDGDEVFLFRDIESINQIKSKQWDELSKKQKGFVFDGFLKKNDGNIKLFIDQGYILIKDDIETFKTVYTINAENGVNLLDTPSVSGKVLDKLDNEISVRILNRSGEFFEVDGLKGQWVEVETYNPSGLFIKDDTDTENIYGNSLECHMCGYQVIIENSGNSLTIEKGFQGDYGDATIDTYSFSISKDELVYTEFIDGLDSPLSMKLVSLNSDSALLKKIKKSNAKKKELFSKKKIENAQRQRESEALDHDDKEREEYIYYLLFDALPIKNPKDANDFYQLAMTNILLTGRSEDMRGGYHNVSDHMRFKPDSLQAIEYFDQAIELNPVFSMAFYQRGLMKKSLNIKSGCDDIIKALSLEGFSMPYSAKEFIKNNCEIDLN